MDVLSGGEKQRIFGNALFGSVVLCEVGHALWDSSTFACMYQSTTTMN